MGDLARKLALGVERVNVVNNWREKKLFFFGEKPKKEFVTTNSFVVVEMASIPAVRSKGVKEMMLVPIYMYYHGNPCFPCVCLTLYYSTRPKMPIWQPWLGLTEDSRTTYFVLALLVLVGIGLKREL